jgi:hypothetical protein
MTQIQNYPKLIGMKVIPDKVLHQMKAIHVEKHIMVKTESNGQQKSMSAKAECQGIE